MRWLVALVLLAGCDRGSWQAVSEAEPTLLDLRPSSPTVRVSVDAGLLASERRRGAFETSWVGLTVGVQHYLADCLDSDCELGIDTVDLDQPPNERERANDLQVRLDPGGRAERDLRWRPALEDCGRRESCPVQHDVDIHLVGDELIELELQGRVAVGGEGRAGVYASEMFVEVTVEPHD